MMKGNDNYFLEATSNPGGQPYGGAIIGGSYAHSHGTAILTVGRWTHLALTYDGANLRFYVDGALTGTTPTTGSIASSATALTIGSDPFYGQYYAGLIDEIRIYNTALTQAQIQYDMETPITGGLSDDHTPPTVTISSPAAGAQVTDIVNITADADDESGVAGVQFFVDNVAVGAEDATAPYGLSWDSRTVANGAHTLTAAARDPAGNVAVSTPVGVNVTNTNYFTNEILATGFALPTNIEFLPDGRMLVVELAGTIKVLPPPYVQPSPIPFLQLTNIGSAGVQQGIYDIALDPAFTTNHYYYVFYTLGSPNRDRLSRFTANSSLTGTVAGSEMVLYQDPQDANAEHHGGAIVFGNDGKLYFTTGEHFDPAVAQSLSNPRGKIHRINPDGTIPTDNPFFDGNGPNVDSVWARGLRNPFRAYYDAPTGRLFIGDVGGNDDSTAKEEIDLGVAGANYAWPNCEGICGAPYRDPDPHLGPQRPRLLGHGRLRLPRQPVSELLPGQLLLCRLHAELDQAPDVRCERERQRRLQLRAGQRLGRRSVRRYRLSDRRSGRSPLLRRSRLLGHRRDVRSQQDPTDPLQPVEPGACGGRSSVDDLGAGTARRELLERRLVRSGGSAAGLFVDIRRRLELVGCQPDPRYVQAGNYTARLTVSDGVNSTLSPPIAISVGSAPTPTILTPHDGDTFRAGDVISFSGDATDTEDGSLPASAYSWSIDFLHEGHVHPAIPQTGVKSGSFTIPTTGHDFSGLTRYRVTLTVTDSDGLTASRSVLVWPQKVNLTFNTVPAGLTLYLDGIAKVTPFVDDALIGFNQVVEARSQTSGGTAYTFASWSDGGAQQHTIVVPSTAQSYTATFNGTPVVSAPTFVQVGSSTPQTSQTTVSTGFQQAQAAGNLNVVVVGWNNATSNVVSVTDTAGNAYQLAAPTTAAAGRSARRSTTPRTSSPARTRSPSPSTQPPRTWTCGSRSTPASTASTRSTSAPRPGEAARSPTAAASPPDRPRS